MPRLSLLLLCLPCFCWAFSFGAECPLCSRFLQDRGHAESAIGINSGLHFVGILLGGLTATALIARHIRATILFGMVLIAPSMLMFREVDLIGAGALRVLSGFGGAWVMIGLEAWINQILPEDCRSRGFAWYAIAISCGFAAGSWTGLNLYQSRPGLAFALAGLVPILGALPIRFVEPVAIVERASAAKLSIPFLSLGAALAQGFLEAGFLMLLPVYLISLGMTDADTGNILAAILVGILVSQLPLAWLADRWSRSKLLVLMLTLVAAVLLALPWVAAGPVLTVLLIVAGVASGCFYPLGLAILGEKLSPADIPKANAWYLGVNSLGSLVSPPVTGVLMAEVGGWSMFLPGAAVVLMVVIGFWFVRPRMLK